MLWLVFTVGCSRHNIVSYDAGGPVGGEVLETARIGDVHFALTASTLYRSRDNGRSWRPVAELGWYEGFLVCGSAMLLPANAGGRLASRDNGETWTPIRTPGENLDCNSRLLVSAPNSADFGYRDGDTIRISTDFGSTWRKIAFPDTTRLSRSGGDVRVGTSKLYVSDGKNAFQSAGSGRWVPVPPLSGIKSHDIVEHGGVFWAAKDTTVWRSVDDGATWRSVGPVSAGRLDTLTAKDRVFLRDSVASSSFGMDVAHPSLRAIPQTIHELGALGNELVARTDSGVYRRTPQGRWTREYTGPTFGLAADQTSLVVTADEGSLSVRHVGQPVWQRLLLDSGLWVEPPLARIGNRTLSAKSGRHDGFTKVTWVTDDGDVQSSAEDRSVVKVLFAEDSVVWAGTDAGLRVSRDSGATWSERYPGLTNPLIHALASHGPRLFAGSTGATLERIDRSSRLPSWKRLRAEGLRGDIEQIWVSPASAAVLFVRTSEDVYWSDDGGRRFTGVSAGKSVLWSDHVPTTLAVVRDTLFIGSSRGVLRMSHIPEPSGMIAIAERRVRWLHERSGEPAFWFLAPVGSLLAGYGVGLVALLLLAWRRGSAALSKTWLRRAAAKPLALLPGVARPLLYIGYRRRLLRDPRIAAVANNYFGLPAEAPAGDMILPAPDGSELHGCVAGALKPQSPVLLVGVGGAGKSTVLSRLAWLSLTTSVPPELRGLRPVLVSPLFREGPCYHNREDAS